MRARLLVPALVAVVLAGCAEDGVGRFCDVLKRQEAAADPFDEAVLQDPARLRRAFADALTTYDQLDRTAPAALATDTATLLQAYREFDALFAKVDYVASKVDAVGFTARRNDAFRSAEAAVARFGVGTCGVRIGDRPAP